jgi:hypothetical protein
MATGSSSFTAASGDGRVRLSLDNVDGNADEESILDDSFSVFGRSFYTPEKRVRVGRTPQKLSNTMAASAHRCNNSTWRQGWPSSFKSPEKIDNDDWIYTLETSDDHVGRFPFDSSLWMSPTDSHRTLPDPNLWLLEDDALTVQSDPSDMRRSSKALSHLCNMRESRATPPELKLASPLSFSADSGWVECYTDETYSTSSEDLDADAWTTLSDPGGLSRTNRLWSLISRQALAKNKRLRMLIAADGVEEV